MREYEKIEVEMPYQREIVYDNEIFYIAVERASNRVLVGERILSKDYGRGSTEVKIMWREAQTIEGAQAFIDKQMETHQGTNGTPYRALEGMLSQGIYPKIPSGGYASRKLDKLAAAKRHFLSAPDGISTAQLAVLLNVSLETAHRYIKELNCTETAPHRYTLEPSQQDIELATAILWRAGIKKDAP